MSGPTKGPWSADLHHTRRDGGRTYGFIRAEGHLVPIAAVPLEVDGYGREEGEANAHVLGASLALLDLAKLFERTILYYIDIDTDDEGKRLKTVTLNQVRAVIAKAEGRADG